MILSNIMSEIDLEKTKHALIKIANSAGDLLMELFGSDSLVVESKSDNSPVTQADLQAQKLILAELARQFPGIPVASEELSVEENTSAMVGCFFIVDPLDSTKNFATGIPFFDVSIALVKDGVPMVGVVRDPVHDTTYSAVRGAGAWRNGNTIRVRPCSQLSEADLNINVTRLPNDQYRRAALKIVPAAKKVRYFGSAVIEGCWVASGMIDGILNHRLSAWDLAAVTLIVEEAGGCWGDLDGRPYRLDSLQKKPFFAVGDQRLMKEVVRLISND
jgi:3'(2'),5'-bisphosphate nucleotidase